MTLRPTAISWQAVITALYNALALTRLYSAHIRTINLLLFLPSSDSDTAAMTQKYRMPHLVEALQEVVADLRFGLLQSARTTLQRIPGALL